METVQVYDSRQDAVVTVDKVEKTDAEWEKLLTRQQYEITTRKGTEPPGSRTFDEVHAPGVFRCVRCGNDLFRGSAKFESGTGWPSFYEPISPFNVVVKPDLSLGMVRIEVLCARCGSHLGHIFDDGPPPTGKRYCMNGFALAFVPGNSATDGTAATEVATLAGGCFWCIEAAFRDFTGVVSAVSGYAGGTTPDPTYEQVCTGKTGHAEVVQVTFDPTRITFREILEAFFSVHDPTTLDRQGPDVGSQYRSAIFYDTEEQRAVAEQVIRELNAARVWEDPIVTQVTPLRKFYPAEDYHQGYFARHPEHGYCQMVISPKLAKFRKQWSGWLTSPSR